MQGREGVGKDGVMSRSESTVSRYTPHTPLGAPDSVSVDSNPMPTIYRYDPVDPAPAREKTCLCSARGIHVNN